MIDITATQLKIIVHLLEEEKPQNIRGLARAIKKSYALVYNNLKPLEKAGIIAFQEIPPAKIVSLNLQAPAEILIQAEKQRTEEFFKKYSWGKVFLKDIVSFSEGVFFMVIIFGSYAKRKETKKSDLDLLVVLPENQDSAAFESVLARAYAPLKKQIIIVGEKEFMEMIKNTRQFNVGNEALRHHLILSGFEQYYHLLMRAKNG